MPQLHQTEQSDVNRPVVGVLSRPAAFLLATVAPVLGVLLLTQQVAPRAETAEAAAGEKPADATSPAATTAKVSARARVGVRHRRCGLLRAGSRLFRCLRRDRSRIYVSQPPPEKPDPYAWKDLFDGKTLEGWKAPEFGGEGQVYVKDGAIVMEMGASMTGITWTGEVIKSDYELTLEGSRLDGIDFFCTTTFPVGDDPCSLVIGGWGGTVVGLSCVDYYDASDNFTTTFHGFKDKQWYKVRIRVTGAKVEAWIDDEQVVNQDRKDHKFGIRDEVDLCRPLGISTWCTTGAVRNIRVRRLKPVADEPDPQPQ